MLELDAIKFLRQRGYVCLTPQERESVMTALNELMQTVAVYIPYSETWFGPTCGRRALVLLSPDEAGDE